MSVDAPYPVTMEEIDNSSIISMDRDGNSIDLLNRGGDVAGSFEVQGEASFVKGFRRIGAFDSDYRDVLIKDWYRPGSPNAKISDPAMFPTGVTNAVSWSPDGIYLAIAHLTMPNITIYKRSGDVLTKLTGPAALPSGNAESVSWSPDGRYLVVGHINYPRVTMYLRDGDVFIKILQPSILPAGGGYGNAFSPDGQYLAIAHNASPWINIYKRDPLTDSQVAVRNNLITNPSLEVAITDWVNVTWLGGSWPVTLAQSTALAHTGIASLRLTATSTSPPTIGAGIKTTPVVGSRTYTASAYVRAGTTGRSVTLHLVWFTAANAHIAGADESSAVVVDSSGAWTRYVATRAAPSNAAYAGLYVTIASPAVSEVHYIDAAMIEEAFGVADYIDGDTVDADGVDYAWLGTAHNSASTGTMMLPGGVLTKLSDPAILPTGSGNAVAWSPDGLYLAVAHSMAPYITIYKRSGDVFTKLANPATLPPSYGMSLSWTPDGQYLALAHDASPYITIYKQSGDVFTKLANPATLPPGRGLGAAWSPDGAYLSVITNQSPHVMVYKRVEDVLMVLVDPVTLPTSFSFDSAWSPDGRYLAVGHDGSPYITTYKSAMGPIAGAAIRID